MSVQFTGDWNKVMKIIQDMEKKWEQAKKRALSKVGQHLVSKLKRGMRDQKPGGQPYDPLHPFTVMRKKSRKALIDHGDLLASITMKLENNMLFVGVLRQAKNDQGESLANLAEIHEFGVEIPVTPKMRKYLHAAGLHLKATTTVIKIPARPTFQPILESEADEIVKILEAEFKKVFG